jgi:hypothetical protein
MEETPLAAQAFQDYCDLGPLDRSLAALHAFYQNRAKNRPPGQKKPRVPSIATLKDWSRAHNWQERVKLFDKEQAEQKRRKRAVELEKMDEEHALYGRTQTLRAIQQIDTLIKEKKFGSTASVQLFKYASDLERLARGAATERQELTGLDGQPLDTGNTILLDVSKLSDKQLALLDQLLDEMKGNDEEDDTGADEDEEDEGE